MMARLEREQQRDDRPNRTTGILPPLASQGRKQLILAPDSARRCNAQNQGESQVNDAGDYDPLRSRRQRFTVGIETPSRAAVSA